MMQTVSSFCHHTGLEMCTEICCYKNGPYFLAHGVKSNMPCKNRLLWTFSMCCRNKENLIELYCVISLNWSGWLLGKRCFSTVNKLDAANCCVWGGLYGTGSRWSGCCSAAALPPLTGWDNPSHHQWSVGRNGLVSQSCTVYLKSGSKHLIKGFWGFFGQPLGKNPSA